MAAEGPRRAGGRPDLLTSIRAEIDARLSELRPQIAEYERLLSAAGALALEDPSVSEPAPAPPRTRRAPRAGVKTKPRASAKPQARATTARRARKRERPAHNPTGQAIVAALEHGSHTVAELVIVTALPAPDIREGLRRLRRHKAIVKTDRDGKTAYTLPAA